MEFLYKIGAKNRERLQVHQKKSHAATRTIQELESIR